MWNFNGCEFVAIFKPMNIKKNNLIKMKRVTNSNYEYMKAETFNVSNNLDSGSEVNLLPESLFRVSKKILGVNF